MKSKLTLSLDKEVIEKGRRIARKEHKSLSSMVEELLNSEIEKDTNAKKEIIEKLHGMFGSVTEGTNWKEEIREAAALKYGK
ncbi:MAG: DUF6364 family protein [Bacteroidetes bacterium]|nr:DUF6364 family protein [Bacteroidota bacterium]MDA1121456.1 DUF6364 family protein [Bacteroidota bacterium]